MCCAPIVREAISAENAVTLAAKFKAIGDPTRLRLLSLVASWEGAEACVCDLTAPVALSHPTVSHHLRLLVDAGAYAYKAWHLVVLRAGPRRAQRAC